MKDFFVKELLAPISRRIGTMAAGGLLALGATQPLAESVELVIPALSAFCIDLILSHRARRK